MTIPKMPMEANEQYSAERRWLQKQVLDSTVLDDTENPANWIHVEQGGDSIHTTDKSNSF